MIHKRSSHRLVTGFAFGLVSLSTIFCSGDQEKLPIDNHSADAHIVSLDAKPEKPPIHYYHVDAYIDSLDAKQSLESYQRRGHVSGTPGANIGSSTPATEISIDLSVESGHFYADLTLTTGSKSKDEKKQRIDLTSLRPVAIDVETDKGGRTYQLSLVPTVKTVRLAPKSFRAVADDMYKLRFHTSRVMLDDKQCIGYMLASDAEFYSVDICGLASVEFSLRHLKDAKPLGSLSAGQISIAGPDGHSISISNVTNGSDDRFVASGPYTVWVRWKKPQSTVEEYRAALRNQRDEIAKNAPAAPSRDTTSDILARIDRELAREPGPWVIGCGAHDLTKNEFMRDE